MATTYKYVANNKDSYNSLAAYAVTLPVTVTLFPQYNTIAISEDAAKEVGKFIDDEALDFIIKIDQTDVDDIEGLLTSPTTDTSILRDIAESFQATMKASAEQYKKNLDNVCAERADAINALEAKKKESDNYAKWWGEESAKNRRIHQQIDAISVLMESIFPKG